MITIPHLLNIVQQALSTFEKCELAYLSLTSKAEFAVRDKLSWILHRQGLDEVIIARELERIDLAIVSNGKVSEVIEFKSMYSFDLISESGLRGYSEEIARDYMKRDRFIRGGAGFKGVSIIVHPHVAVQKHLNGIVKYSAGINAALKRYDSNKIIELCIENWSAQLTSLGFANQYIIQEVGNAFEIPVSIIVFVSDKVSNESLHRTIN